MSRSFTIDLNAYTLYRPIAERKNDLSRKSDVLDVVSILMDEGYQNFEVPMGYCEMKDRDLFGLRKQIQGAVLGVPVESLVTIRHLAGGRLVLVSFT